MFAVRHSGAEIPNPGLRHEPAQEGEGNIAWLARMGIGQGVLLVGGAGLTDVRLRVAQSRLRSDLTPSHWSLAGLLDQDELVTVALDRIGDPGAFAARNGVTSLPVATFDDPARFPNLAIVLFSPTLAPIRAAVEEVANGRAVLDVPALSSAWLSALWGVSDLDAPLRDGLGMPSAALVQLCHAIAGIELTPGLESTASCPEAIWQAARWWTEYYRASAAVTLRAGLDPSADHAQPAVPAGAFVIRSRLVVEPAPSGSREVVGR